MFNYILKWVEKKLLIHYINFPQDSSMEASIVSAVNNIKGEIVFESYFLTTYVNNKYLLELAIENGYDVIPYAIYKECGILKDILNIYAKYGKLQGAVNKPYNETYLKAYEIHGNLQDAMNKPCNDPTRYELCDSYHEQYADACKSRHETPNTSILEFLKKRSDLTDDVEDIIGDLIREHKQPLKDDYSTFYLCSSMAAFMAFSAWYYSGEEIKICGDILGVTIHWDLV